MTRRSILQAGGLGLFGLTTADLVRAEQAKRPSEAAGSDLPGFGRAKSVILLFLVGAPGQNDTWDMKPDAPEAIRGPFRPIETNVPGIAICEHLPLMARLADKFTILRSAYHKDTPIHETGHQLAMTGFAFRGGNEYPSHGSAVSFVKGPNGDLPPYVVLPGPIKNTGVSVPHGQEAGYLGRKFDPFYLNTDPAAPGFRVPDLGLLPKVGPDRLADRRAALQALDRLQAGYESDPTAVARDSAVDRAFGLLFSQKSKQALDLAAEPDSVRDRYGRNTFGQSCLLARRLIEAGVRFVTVNMFDTVFNDITWDCHGTGGTLACTLDDYHQTLMPMLDLAYSALLEDMGARGLLDDTMVVCMGEFGRSPKVGSPTKGGAGAGSFGRDHWPGVWSLLFAGGGIAPGRVVGASDKTGAEPRDRPAHAIDLSATIYHALGIPLDTYLPGQSNRPMPLVDTGAKPVLELFASR